MEQEYSKFDLWYADMSLSVGVEQSGLRPVILLSNQIGNRYSQSVIVCCVTSKTKKYIPTHVYLNLKDESTAMLEQIRTIDKMRLIEKIGHIDDLSVQRKLEEALLISFGMTEYKLHN